MGQGRGGLGHRGWEPGGPWGEAAAAADGRRGRRPGRRQRLGFGPVWSRNGRAERERRGDGDV